MEEKALERDFEQEVRELYEARPQLRGEQLPEEVVRNCAEGKNLSEAYEEYADKQAEKQNENAAAKAPVRSVTGGGSVGAKPEDAFLRGFNAAW